LLKTLIMNFPKLSSIRVLKEEEMTVFKGGAGSCCENSCKPGCSPGCSPGGKTSALAF